MQNKCFLPLQTLQTTKNKLIAPQVSLLKSFWVLGVLIALCYVLGLKGIFVMAETEVGFRDWRKYTLGRLSDTFQTTGRQSDFRPNHRWVMCNYPQKRKKESKALLLSYNMEIRGLNVRIFYLIDISTFVFNQFLLTE